MLLTYKYRIKDRSARKMLRRHAWAANQVWNWCVSRERNREAHYRAGWPKQRLATHFDLTMACRGVGREIGLYQQSVGLICKQFVRSRDESRTIPRYRASSGPKRALGWIPFTMQNRYGSGNTIIFLGKSYRFWEGGRPLPENAKGGNLVEDALGRWYVCFHIQIAEDRPLGTGEIGIDLGLKSLATCSNGNSIEAPHIYRRHEQKLALAHRAGNKRRARAICAKIKNCRQDFTHKATAKLARENALIAIGNVNPSKLARTRFAKSVLDAGWSMFRTQLRYKASRHGAVYLDIDEMFTTQVCSSCGVIPSSSPKGMGSLGIRAWDCSECGAHHDRDVNAARNILALALGAKRRADESRLMPWPHEGALDSH